MALLRSPRGWRSLRLTCQESGRAPWLCPLKCSWRREAEPASNPRSRQGRKVGLLRFRGGNWDAQLLCF